MDINAWIYLFIGFFSWIILWCGFKIIDDRTWSKLDTDVVPAWVLSSGYILTFLRIVQLGVLWISAIPLTSFVVLLVIRIFNRYFIPKWEHVLLCAIYLTLWLYLFVALIYFLGFFGILLGSGGGMGGAFNEY